MRLPDFITFTGADERTDPAEMCELARLYPIEWGILFSWFRQGKDNRYPASGARRFAGYGLGLSAHLCGRLARDIVDGSLASPDEEFNGFELFQINHLTPDPRRIEDFAVPRRAIAQCRGDAFPRDDRVVWLFDRSGGKGIAPTSWPPHPGGARMVGYAGGIGPDNVVDVISAIDCAGPYWIDMESGVRDADDWFSLEKCRRVCEAVYGRKP